MSSADDTRPGASPGSREPGTAAAGSTGTGQPGGAAPAIALPRGGGAIRGIGETFRTNAVTGTASVTVPIPVTPARGDFAPQLALSYDSGSGNGPFGFGWSLSLARIERKTDRGLPRYLDAPDPAAGPGPADAFVLSGAEELVPVGEAVPIDGHVVQRYRPRVDTLFARIERWVRAADSDCHWRSITRDNVTHLYGTSGESRLADPASGGSPADGPARVFAWLICESHDDKGNAILYEYAEEDSAGVDTGRAHEANRTQRSRSANRYPKRIRYGNAVSRLHPDPPADWRDDFHFELVFDYGEGHVSPVPPDPGTPAGEQLRRVRAAAAADTDGTGSTGSWPVRPDPFSSHRPGFEVRTYRRCRRILLFHRFAELGAQPCLVRSTELDYADLDYGRPVGVDAELAHPGSTRFASFVRSIVQSGYVRDESVAPTVVDGATYVTYVAQSLPPLELDYSRARIDDQVRAPDPADLAHLPIGLSGRYRMVDLDGEGIAGVLAEHEGAWRYTPNLGPDPDPGAEPTTVHFGPERTVAARPVLGKLGRGRQLVDLDGDGRLDLLVADRVAPGFHERTDDGGWTPFRPFARRPVLDLDHPDVRLVDLDGDGLADVLVTEDEAIACFRSLGEDGFADAERVRTGWDDEAGPRVVLDDRSDTMYLADMTGDGLVDLVRVRNGEVCYWPSQGYGRFGAKVTMDGAPVLDPPDRFDHRRVRLVDVDGSGTTDLVYLGADGARLHLNRSGNEWTGPRHLTQFPPADRVTSVTAADLLGRGTACLVWSTPLPGPAAGDGGASALRYVDLMADGKPHLLTTVTNNLGTETQVSYVPSTAFSLADKRAGRPWVTRLPFPVQVVERVETHDRVSGNRFVSRFAYHHGHHDGVEREFRGFAQVDQWDTAEWAALNDGEDAGTDPASGSGISRPSEMSRTQNAGALDAASDVPPKLTRSWFHTGAWAGRDRISTALAGEYYQGDPDAVLLPDTVLPDRPEGSGPGPADADDEREACRALKGQLLRQEVYGLDGSARAAHPYTVTEQSYALRRIQAAGPGRHAVFVVHERESLAFTYERDPDDPRVRHKLVLEADDFGNERRTAVVTYPRRRPDLGLDPRERAKQAELRIVVTENDLTDPVEGPDDHRAPLPAEVRNHELTGVDVPAGRIRFAFDDLADPAALVAAGGQLRLLDQARTLYRADDLAGPLPLGEAGARGLPFDSYRLAFTPALLTTLFGSRVTEPMLVAAGYRHSEGDANWWIPTGRVLYSPDPTDGAAAELDHARRHFFQPCRYRDPFHTAALDTETHIAYDHYDLVPVETRDALGNRVTAGERALAAELDPAQPLATVGIDYRVLQPSLVMDPNRNRQRAAFDALGLVVATAVMGKPEDVPARGDSLQGVVTDLADAAVAAALDDPIAHAAGLLGHATTRFVNDVAAYHRTRDDAAPRPPAVLRLARETHVSDLSGAAASPLQYLVSYSDGFGREVQRKTRVEPDGGLDPRWVGSGWKVYDTKGNPVRQYEPFFAATAAFERDVRAGVSPILCHDPLERVVATIHPNHTWEKVAFDAWGSASWDPNDTVLIADPTADLDVGDWFRRLPAADRSPTWHTRRIGGALGTDEQAAARRAEVHAATPTRLVLDPMGRTVLTEVHNAYQAEGAAPSDPRVEEHHATRVTYDVQGNPTEVVDANDRVVARYGYDRRGSLVRTSSMEAGDRRIFDNAAGEPACTWDGLERRLRTVYDALRRPVELRLLEGAGPEVVVERTTYGESTASPGAANLRKQVVEQRDQAGVLTMAAYDFKGNLTRGTRRFTADATVTADWSGAVPLDGVVYEHRSRFDALERPVELTTPDGSRVLPTFNQAGLVERVDVAVRGAAPTAFVTGTAYDPRGQRTRVDLGNGATTTYEYDAETFRLRRLRTTRPGPGGAGGGGGGTPVVLQDLRYTFDPVGNITHVHDDAQQDVFFANRRVEPSADYTYDAAYQLIEATGREHLAGVAGGVPASYDDGPRLGLAHPHDGNALGRYRERYRYDPVGNLLSLAHRGTDPQAAGWVRTYTYDEPSQLEPAKRSNRLTGTTVGTTTETYSTGGDGYDADGNQLRLPHLSAMLWDHRDQLRMTERGGERTWYVYGADGTRVRKVTEDAAGNLLHERRYMGGFEVFVRTGTNALVRETLHVREGNAAERAVALVETRTDVTSTPRVRYQLGDHLGSVRLELGDTAQIVSYEEYTPFGTTSLQTTTLDPSVAPFPAAKRYRYTGRERDDESGLSHSDRRYYAPWLGRWTSADPAGLRDSVNRYAYVRNHPTGLVDPEGTLAVTPDVLGPALLGATGPPKAAAAGKGGGSSGSAAAKGGPGPKGDPGGNAVGGFFDSLASGLAKVANVLGEWLPGVMAAPIAGLVDVLGGFLRTLGGIFSWKGGTVLQGIKEMGLGVARILGLREVLAQALGEPGGFKTFYADIEESRIYSRDVIKDPWINGHKSWHAGTNALIQQRLGPSPLGIVGLWLGGIWHESPLDKRSFDEEQKNQGTVNHILDSLLDLVANVFGQIIGLIFPRQAALWIAARFGRYVLPGPADHDPKFHPGEAYKGNPLDAWTKWKNPTKKTP